MKAPSRDHYVREALPLVESMLQLLDRNPLSKTAGCFDRQYWHYRTMDFPSGMSQECVLPVALAWRHPFPDNPYRDEPRLREWVLSGIDFARRSGHRDGSCDDYYPFERALGAAVFSLAAMADAYRIIRGEDDALENFLAARARWVISHGESGVLANHHAIAAAALWSVYCITGDEKFAAGAREKAQEVLAHQHEEGWFREYDGFDPGYQTVTVDFLARYWKDSQDETVLPALERAVDLLERVQHPDGTFGGEYGARNTHHAQPHGFEILAPRIPAARKIADRFLSALAAGHRVRNDDDRLQAHHVYPYLLAWLDHEPREEPAEHQAASERSLLPECGFLIDRRPDTFLIAGLRKGGALRCYRNGHLVTNDSGATIVLENGRVLVTHLDHDSVVEDDGKTAIVRGRFHVAKGELMTPFKSVLLRVFMLTFGRLFRTYVRKLLQRRLILGKEPAPFRFERQITRSEAGGFRVTDLVTREGEALPVRHLRLGVGQTSTYTAASQPWDRGWLLQWTDLDHLVPTLNEEGRAEFGRDL